MKIKESKFKFQFILRFLSCTLISPSIPSFLTSLMLLKLRLSLIISNFSEMLDYVSTSESLSLELGLIGLEGG